MKISSNENFPSLTPSLTWNKNRNEENSESCPNYHYDNGQNLGNSFTFSSYTFYASRFGMKTFCTCNPDLQAIATVTDYVQTVTAMLMPALCSRLTEIIPHHHPRIHPPPPPKKMSLGHCNNWHLLLFFSVFVCLFSLQKSQVLSLLLIGWVCPIKLRHMMMELSYSTHMTQNFAPKWLF